MTYMDQWKSISARIQGLNKAADFYVNCLSVNASDSYGIHKHLRKQVTEILDNLRTFKASFQNSLPLPAHDAIDRLTEKATPLVGEDADQRRVLAVLVFLHTFEGELSFLLSDSQSFIRARSELAFVHLQRLIVADPDARQKWGVAFEQGEVACEKLGAVHMLHHGIWAFKADAAGGRTDLILPDQTETSFGFAQNYALGLVLTEWKKAGRPTDVTPQYNQALNQARLYSTGVIGGTELAIYRYLVVVSKKQVAAPPDKIENGVIYRSINIAVDPATPSRA